ncbi:hypothetical protein [Shimia isoporae]|nr:hypothetical protein [Shimia isoporae]
MARKTQTLASFKEFGSSKLTFAPYILGMPENSGSDVGISFREQLDVDSLLKEHPDMPDGSNLFPRDEEIRDGFAPSLPQEVLDYFDDITATGDVERMAPGWWLLPAMCVVPVGVLGLVLFS